MNRRDNVQFNNKGLANLARSGRGVLSAREVKFVRRRTKVKRTNYKTFVFNIQPEKKFIHQLILNTIPTEPVLQFISILLNLF